MKVLSKAKTIYKLVNEVRTALDKLGAVNILTIRWVPGHPPRECPLASLMELAGRRVAGKTEPQRYTLPRLC